ncbi:translin [Belonocnema kinseyi]|uniref:translin n=1 Tax=Belonocnema kinseyi TaxID=2817044 RepID=UPI00143D53AD|nr:translin [Belonocnema kinseyi]
MTEEIQQIFNSFQDYLNTEQDLREEIRIIVKEIDKSARDILIILQNIHNDNKEENTMKSKAGDGFHLDVEDFLMGLCKLANELTRFAVNSVTNGDFNRPVEIARFVNELNAGFRLLNLKNDALRKGSDALKYDVKKIEEVVYDLSIRGLKPENAEAPQETD